MIRLLGRSLDKPQEPGPVSEELIAAAKILGVEIPNDAFSEVGGLTFNGGMLLHAKISRAIAEHQVALLAELTKFAELYGEDLAERKGIDIEKLRVAKSKGAE